MKESTIDRAALAELLAGYGDSLESFDALRPDAYEQVLARQPSGLDFLRSFYAEIMKPGQSQAEAALKCPTWPLGSKYERKRPTPGIVSQVSERLRTRQTLGQFNEFGRFLAEMRKALGATPVGETQATLDAACKAMGSHLIKGLSAGGAPNLKLVEKLQQQRVIEQNEKRLAQNDEKIKLIERRVQLLENREAETKRVVADTALTDAEKQERIRQIMGLS